MGTDPTMSGRFGRLISGSFRCSVSLIMVIEWRTSRGLRKRLSLAPI
uniref:Uncharacterized protein n=1 Tax=Arundo donax TaxID=35708 RepID=A0A0A9FGA7_ARUDO